MNSTLPEPGGTVMIVDDDEVVLRTIRRTLERLGVRVVTASRPFGLLNLIAETQPLLVLLGTLISLSLFFTLNWFNFAAATIALTVGAFIYLVFGRTQSAAAGEGAGTH